MTAFVLISAALASATPTIEDAAALVTACTAPGSCAVPCWDDAKRETEPGPNGALQVSCWLDGVSHGPVVAWYPSGQPLGVGYSKQGEPHGGAVSWHPNGKRASESMWVDGRREGPLRTWHANGQLASQAHWRDGRQDGVVRFWHPNGQLDEAVEWVQGQPHGPMFSWHEDGTLKAKTRFQHGARHGRWVLRYPSGRRSVVARFRAGKAVHLRCWEPDGKQTLCPTDVVALFHDGAGPNPESPRD